MSALATLALLLLATNPGVGTSKTLEPPLLPTANGFGPPVHSSEARNFASTAGRSLWVTSETRVPGSKSKKSVATLDGYNVQTHVLPEYRALQFALTPVHDLASVRTTSARAPPVPAFAI